MNRYRDIPVLKNKEVNNGSRYYSTTRYPEIPLSPSDIYVITSEGDSLDALAQQFYQDKSLWWVLSVANGIKLKVPTFIKVGSQLRIPTDLQNILSAYDRINN